MPPQRNTSGRNALLAALPAKERAELLERCESVNLIVGKVLCEADQPLSHGYFPLTGFISLLSSIAREQPLELGLIGREGMLGATLALGINSAPMRAVVQGSGEALRIRSVELRRHLNEHVGVGSLLDRYLYVSITQLARSSVCLCFHELGPRLARWLLMTHDRAEGDVIQLTHEFLADMLGVRRSGVSEAAATFQRKGLIAYHRGEITVLDRKALEAAACACYMELNRDYAKIFRRPA